MSWLRKEGTPIKLTRRIYEQLENAFIPGVPHHVVYESARSAALYIRFGSHPEEQEAINLARQIYAKAERLEKLASVIDVRRKREARRQGYDATRLELVSMDVEELVCAAGNATSSLETTWGLQYPTSLREWQKHVRVTMGKLLELGVEEADVLGLFPGITFAREAQLKQLQRARKEQGLPVRRGRPPKEPPKGKWIDRNSF